MLQFIAGLKPGQYGRMGLDEVDLYGLDVMSYHYWQSIYDFNYSYMAELTARNRNLREWEKVPGGDES